MQTHQRGTPKKAHMKCAPTRDDNQVSMIYLWCFMLELVSLYTYLSQKAHW